MTGGRAYLAIDVGAESGRALLGRFDGERVELAEVHRFPNVPVCVVDGLHWDALRIFQEVKDGLAKAAHVEPDLASVAIDTWGADFGLLDRTGALVSNPFHYRDRRTDGVPSRVFARVPWPDLYRTTGIQFMPINTLFQLASMAGSPLLNAAETLLLIPDLLNYWLTGERAVEFTNATTTQLYDLAAHDWAWDLIGRLGLPARLFPRLIQPGTGLAGLLPGVAEETGVIGGLPVAAVASHDTASAVAAVPAVGGNFAYVSSGTWSLVGVETATPIVTPEAMMSNFTNEGGLGGTVRFLKNVTGLWLLQECRRTWARSGRDSSYDDLVALAEAALPFGPLIDPDHPAFLPPGDMPARIAAACRATGQQPPEGPGATVRCILESLALKYRWVLERIEQVSGREIEVVHVVGGGCRNALLCRLTAGASRRPVLAGPVEATAIGNVLVQALARGDLRSPAELRAVVRRSTDVRTFAPDGSAAAWDAAAARMERLIATSQAGGG